MFYFHSILRCCSAPAVGTSFVFQALGIVVDRHTRSAFFCEPLAVAHLVLRTVPAAEGVIGV